MTSTHSASVTIPLLAHNITTYFESVHKVCFKVGGWMDGGGEGIICRQVSRMRVSFTTSPLLVSGLGDEYTVHTSSSALGRQVLPSVSLRQ